MAFDIGDCIIDEDIEHVAVLVLGPDGRILKVRDDCDLEYLRRFCEWDRATSSLCDFPNLFPPKEQGHG